MIKNIVVLALFMGMQTLGVKAHKAIVEEEEEPSIEITNPDKFFSDHVASQANDGAQNVASESGDFKFPAAGGDQRTLKGKLTEFLSHDPEWYLEHCKIEMIWSIIFLISFLKYRQGK